MAEILDLVLRTIVSEVAIHFGEIHFIRVSDMTGEDQGEVPGNTCQGEVPMNMVAEIEEGILTKGEEDMEVQLILQFKIVMLKLVVSIDPILCISCAMEFIPFLNPMLAQYQGCTLIFTNIFKQ